MCKQAIKVMRAFSHGPGSSSSEHLCLNEPWVKQKAGRAAVCFFPRPSGHHLLPALDIIFPPPCQNCLSSSQPGIQGPVCLDPTGPSSTVSHCSPFCSNQPEPPAPHTCMFPSHCVYLEPGVPFPQLNLVKLCPSNTTPPLSSPNPLCPSSAVYHVLEFIHSFTYLFTYSSSP